MKVKSNATYIFRCCGINILPGINFITRQTFLSHPAVKSRLEAGLLELIEEEEIAEENAEAHVATILSSNAKKAQKEVSEIFDLAVLEEIAKNDTRVSIQRAAKAQIEQIKPPLEEKSE